MDGVERSARRRDGIRRGVPGTGIFWSLLFFFFALNVAADVGIGSDSGAAVVPETSSPELVRDRSLAKFIAALLEKDHSVRAGMLLDVIAEHPGEAEIPLGYFVRAAGQSRKLAEWAKKYNPLWERNPLLFHFAVHGALLNAAAGTAPHEIVARLEKYLVSGVLPGKEIRPTQFALLLEFYFGGILRSGKYEQGDRIFRGVLNRLPAGYQMAAKVAALGFYEIAAVREDIAGNEKEAEKFEAFYAELLNSAGKEAIDSPEMLDRLLGFLLRRRQLDDALELAKAAVAARETPVTLGLLELVAAENGDLKEFNSARRKLTGLLPEYRGGDNPELRFTALLKAGEFSAAEKLIGRLPPRERADARFKLLTERRDFRAMRDLLTREKTPGVMAGLRLLTVAEKLRDHEAFAAAKKILERPAMDNPQLANALGYVGAVLNTDLDGCGKYVEFALSREPENSAFLDSMAWVRFKQGRLDEAHEMIQKALQCSDPVVGVAVLLEHAGDIAAARGGDPQPLYRKAWKYAGDDPEIDVAALKKKIIWKK